MIARLISLVKISSQHLLSISAWLISASGKGRGPTGGAPITDGEGGGIIIEGAGDGAGTAGGSSDGGGPTTEAGAGSTTKKRQIMFKTYEVNVETNSNFTHIGRS